MIIQMVEWTGITKFDATTEKHSQQVKLQQKVKKNYILRCITFASGQVLREKPVALQAMLAPAKTISMVS